MYCSPLVQAIHSRPTLGDAVIVLDTEHAKKYCPDLIGKTDVVRIDNKSTVPFQIRGSDAVWFGESMLQFVSDSNEAGCEVPVPIVQHVFHKKASGAHRPSGARLLMVQSHLLTNDMNRLINGSFLLLFVAQVLLSICVTNLIG